MPATVVYAHYESVSAVNPEITVPAGVVYYRYTDHKYYGQAPAAEGESFEFDTFFDLKSIYESKGFVFI